MKKGKNKRNRKEKASKNYTVEDLMKKFNTNKDWNRKK